MPILTWFWFRSRDNRHTGGLCILRDLVSFFMLHVLLFSVPIQRLLWYQARIWLYYKVVRTIGVVHSLPLPLLLLLLLLLLFLFSSFYSSTCLSLCNHRIFNIKCKSSLPAVTASANHVLSSWTNPEDKPTSNVSPQTTGFSIHLKRSLTVVLIPLPRSSYCDCPCQQRLFRFLRLRVYRISSIWSNGGIRQPPILGPGLLSWSIIWILESPGLNDRYDISLPSSLLTLKPDGLNTDVTVRTLFRASEPSRVSLHGSHVHLFVGLLRWTHRCCRPLVVVW